MVSDAATLDSTLLRNDSAAVGAYPGAAGRALVVELGVQGAEVRLRRQGGGEVRQPEADGAVHAQHEGGGGLPGACTAHLFSAQGINYK